MQAWMWRLTDDHAVIYTDDKATLKALFAYSRFPHQDLARATTYERKNGRAFAWQFTFPVSAWNGVVRYLGRASITMLDQERWITVAEVTQPEPPIETPRKTTKGGAVAPVAPKKKERAPTPARKSAPRPVVDLTEPLRPMVSATAKASAPKAQPVATVPATATPTPAASTRNASPGRKATAPTPATSKLREPKSVEEKSSKPNPAPPPVTTATKAGGPKRTSVPANPSPVIAAIAAAPISEPQRPPGRRKKALVGDQTPPEELRVDVLAERGAAVQDEQVAVVIDDVQRRMVAPVVRAVPSDSVLPGAKRGRVKAGGEPVPSSNVVNNTPSVSLRASPSTGGRRKPVAVPEPALAAPSPRAGATAVAPERAAPVAATSRKRGAKPG